MKLEVGKFYVVRDPHTSGIDKVRVDSIREDISDENEQVATTLFRYDGDILDSTCSLDGRILTDYIEPSDLVAEYIPTSILLTPKDVGCSVELANGDICIVSSYSKEYNVFTIYSTSYYSNGVPVNTTYSHLYKVVKVLRNT